jgi:hypothetical protein
MSRSHTMPSLTMDSSGPEHKQHGSSQALAALIAIDSIQEEDSITGDSTATDDHTAEEADSSGSHVHSSQTLRTSLERKRAMKQVLQRKVGLASCSWHSGLHCLKVMLGVHLPAVPAAWAPVRFRQFSWCRLRSMNAGRYTVLNTHAANQLSVILLRC